MTRALIVEDDPRIRETVVDVVESLGHDHDTASCQEAARQFLTDQRYGYALLDLEIPVKEGRNFPRIENGFNLLREVINHFGKQTPVIVMTAHGNDGPHQSVDCMKLGAADYIPKPFPIRGRTLDKAILEALEKSGQAGGKRLVPGKPSGPPRKFEGGRIVLHKHRVEVCGATIPITEVMSRLLNHLAERRPTGKFIAYAGSELAELLEIEGGQNKIATQILEFRKKVVQRLLEEANIACERTSIIASGGSGYRFQDSILVELSKPATCGASEMNPEYSAETSSSDFQELPTTANAWNERQIWALKQMKRGVRMQSGLIASHFACSMTTAKRDLLSLKSAGLIRFVGSARTGHYHLAGANEDQKL